MIFSPQGIGLPVKLQGCVVSDNGIVLEFGGNKIRVDFHRGRLDTRGTHRIRAAPHPEEPARGHMQSKEVVSSSPGAAAGGESSQEVPVAENRISGKELKRLAILCVHNYKL